jgi:hypothetical protein
MSRRPTCDRVESGTETAQVVEDKSPVYVENMAVVRAVSESPVKVESSNLMSNENVVAFAPGIVIDDGVSSATPLSDASVELSLNKSPMPVFTRDDLIQDAVQRCMQRHETR